MIMTGVSPAGSKKGKMTGGDLSTGEQEALMAAAADGGLYTVSIPSNIHIDAPPYVQASTRAVRPWVMPRAH